MAENHPSRQTGPFIQLEQFLFASHPTSNIEICANDLHDILLFLHRFSSKENFKENQEPASIKNADHEDENNNIKKEFNQEYSDEDTAA